MADVNRLEPRVVIDNVRENGASVVATVTVSEKPMADA